MKPSGTAGCHSAVALAEAAAGGGGGSPCRNAAASSAAPAAPAAMAEPLTPGTACHSRVSTSSSTTRSPCRGRGLGSGLAPAPRGRPVAHSALSRTAAASRRRGRGGGIASSERVSERAASGRARGGTRCRCPRHRTSSARLRSRSPHSHTSHGTPWTATNASVRFFWEQRNSATGSRQQWSVGFQVSVSVSLEAVGQQG
jgi:hypothetical protein